MQEYHGESAKSFKQHQDKYFTLFPALERMLPRAEKGQRLVDLACGSGDLFELCEKKEYEYLGVDISEDMLSIARQKWPGGDFVTGDATKSLSSISGKYDVILSNMLFPSISNTNEMEGAFEACDELLTDEGLLLTSSTHPCFDGYMGKKFFDREDIEAVFGGYFNSGSEYKAYKKIGDNDFVFINYHWTLSSYVNAAKKFGFYLYSLDECPLSGEVPAQVSERINKRGTPSYIVFGWKKMNIG